MQGDIPANFTFVDKQGCSTIDLFCTSIGDTELIDELRTLDIVSQSDHDSIALTLNVCVEKEKKAKNRKKLR